MLRDFIEFVRKVETNDRIMEWEAMRVVAVRVQECVARKCAELDEV
jgi:hypothetical protein